MPEAPAELRLLVLIARSEHALDELITGLLDVGVSGATVIESKGLAAIVREDMPIFAGLAALLPQNTGSRVVLSITSAEVIEALHRFIAEMHEDDRPIGIALPIERGFGGPFGAVTLDTPADTTPDTTPDSTAPKTRSST